MEIATTKIEGTFFQKNKAKLIAFGFIAVGVLGYVYLKNKK